MVLVPAGAMMFTLRKVLLMQLSVALSLHFGCDSQLNTSEMFSIDISRWMISELMLMNKRSTRFVVMLI